MAKIQKIKISQQQQNSHKKSTLRNKRMSLSDVFDDIDDFFTKGDYLLQDNPSDYSFLKDCENDYLKLVDDNYDDIEMIEVWNEEDDTANRRKIADEIYTVINNYGTPADTESRNETITTKSK